MNTDDSESHAHPDPTMDLSRADFGSCVAAFAVNDRLTVSLSYTKEEKKPFWKMVLTLMALIMMTVEGFMCFLMTAWEE